MITPKYTRATHPDVPEDLLTTEREILIDESQKPFMDRYTPQMLTLHPERIWSMNSNAISQWFSDHYGLQVYPSSKVKIPKGESRIKLKPIRDLITERKRHIDDAKKIIEHGRDLHESIIQFHRAVCGLLDSMSGKDVYGVSPYAPERSARKFASNSRNTIWDMPFVPLGLHTTKALRSKQSDNNFKATAEHCYPRTPTMQYLLEWCLHERKKKPGWLPSRRDIALKCLSASVVVYVHKEENEKSLPPFQKYDTFEGPCESYKSAGLQLVRVTTFNIPYVWQFIMDIHNIKEWHIAAPDFSEITITMEQFDIDCKMAFLAQEEQKRSLSVRNL